MVILVVLLAVGGGIYFFTHRSPHELVLTGVVDGEEVAVESKITARVDRLNVREGDVVHAGDVVAVLDRSELDASLSAARALAAQAQQSVQQSNAQVGLLQAALPAAVAQARDQVSAAAAELEQAHATLTRVQANGDRVLQLAAQGIDSALQREQAQADLDSAHAGVRLAQGKLAAAQAALANALAQQRQVAVQRQQTDVLAAAQRAAQAQQQAASARLDQTALLAPLGGVVTLRAARAGEVVNPGSPVVTIFNLGDTWVQADIEETYADQVRLGERVRVRLPSGVEIPGTVFYKATEADFATQRDVSRTKRDIKTVALRVRVNNADGRLARGMTAWVVFPSPSVAHTGGGNE